MKFSVDYDKTYTEAPELFNNIISMIKLAGHDVVCVTMRRFPDEQIKMPCDVVYTDRRAKALYCEENNIVIDVWIDDSPHWLLHNG